MKRKLRFCQITWRTTPAYKLQPQSPPLLGGVASCSEMRGLVHLTFEYFCL